VTWKEQKRIGTSAFAVYPNNVVVLLGERAHPHQVSMLHCNIRTRFVSRNKVQVLSRKIALADRQFELVEVEQGVLLRIRAASTTPRVLPLLLPRTILLPLPLPSLCIQSCTWCHVHVLFLSTVSSHWP